MIGLGLDGGDDQPLKVVAVLTIPRRTEGGPKGKSSRIIAATGKTLAEALDQVQREAKGPLSLGQIRLVLFGNRLSPGGMDLAVQGLTRNPQIRLDSFTAATDTDPEQVLSLSPTEEEFLPLQVGKLLETEVLLGNIPESSLGRFIADHLDGGVDPVLPRLVVKDDSVAVDGTKVFPRHAEPTTLTAAQTKAYLVAIGRRTRAISFPGLEGGSTVVRPIKSDSDIRVYRDPASNLSAEIRCHVEADLIEGEPLPEATMGRELERQIHEVIHVTQTAGADVTGLGLRALSLLTPQERAQWDAILRTLDVKVRVTYVWRRKRS